MRFRTVHDEAFKDRPEEGPLHVAWFQPDHHIVEAIGPFFVRRFTQMRWAILTPECSVEWNGSTLDFEPGALKEDEEDAPPADADELLWLTYYQNTFNPARLKRIRGRPFVGPAEQLLDRAFKDLGWSRSYLYLTNAGRPFNLAMSPLDVEFLPLRGVNNSREGSWLWLSGNFHT